jgi:hypothetical protein
MSTPQQNWKKSHNMFCLEARGVEETLVGGQEGEMAQTMYVHMNK